MTSNPKSTLVVVQLYLHVSSGIHIVKTNNSRYNNLDYIPLFRLHTCIWGTHWARTLWYFILLWISLDFFALCDLTGVLWKCLSVCVCVFWNKTVSPRQPTMNAGMSSFIFTVFVFLLQVSCFFWLKTHTPTLSRFCNILTHVKKYRNIIFSGIHVPWAPY